MFRLLVVDDEVWIRERISQMIDWNLIQVEVIGEAADGEEALKKTRELKPDIVLTDIRMPCIDGLEFTKALKDEQLKSKVIILSGYSDFEYAQSAIKLGAFDYILKPVNDEELLNTVKRCTLLVEKEEKRDSLLQDLQKKMKANSAVMRERFILNLLNGYYPSEERARQEFRYFYKSVDHYNYLCFVVQLDELEREESVEELNLLQFGMCNITKDYADFIGENDVVLSSNGEVVCVLCCHDSLQDFLKRVVASAYEIKALIKEVFHKTVSIGIGNPCQDILNLSLSCQQARQVLLYKAYLGKDMVYHAQSMEDRSNAYRIDSYEIEKIKNHIEAGNKNEVACSVQRIISSLKEQEPVPRPLDLKAAYMDIIYSVIKSTDEFQTLPEILPTFDYLFFEKLNNIQSIDDFERNLEEISYLLIDHLLQVRSKHKRKIIGLALAYIEEHYQEPITLNDVAGEIFLNPSYFCKIFKMEMNESFTKYLMKFRVKKAVELLNDPCLKIYEIAEQVGYSDVQYFTKIFKTVTGDIPTHYRNRLK